MSGKLASNAQALPMRCEGLKLEKFKTVMTAVVKVARQPLDDHLCSIPIAIITQQVLQPADLRT
jgi:hypothetical protein